MKKIILTGTLLITLISLKNTVAAQTSTSKSTKIENVASSDKKAIEEVITSYQNSLNASDAGKVVALFTKGGVLMANAAPTAEGTDQVKGTYQYVFDNFTYDLKFSVIDVIVEGNTAFVRSTSKGSFVIKANGQKSDAEFRELFVFQKENGSWKIARYMYNQTK